MTIILAITSAILLIFSLTMALNIFMFPKLKRKKIGTLPLVSVLIPARNEAQVIEMTIRNHLAQDYPNFELIILDDNSDDGTDAIIESFKDSRLKMISGKALPKFWFGKVWACKQLSEAAQGEILIFTDADVQWQPDALSALVSEMQASDVEMLTVWPSQITKTWPERLTVPLMALVILGYLPLMMVHHSPFAIFAAANGQCMAWKRSAYFAIGGHDLVAQNVLDDVTLARAAKEAGYRIRMADGNGKIQTRMYQDWPSVRKGFAKNIIAGYGSVAALVAASILHWLIFLLPYALLFWTDYQVWAAILIVTGIGLRAVSAWFTKQRILDALLMPISVILMSIIAGQAIYWRYTGGTEWKGRKLQQWQKQSS